MTHLPNLSETYSGLYHFTCNRCDHTYLSKQPRPQCPVCHAPISHQIRSEVINYSNEGQAHDHNTVGRDTDGT
jgi:ribosomal protein L37E